MAQCCMHGVQKVQSTASDAHPSARPASGDALVQLLPCGLEHAAAPLLQDAEHAIEPPCGPACAPLLVPVSKDCFFAIRACTRASAPKACGPKDKAEDRSLIHCDCRAKVYCGNLREICKHTGAFEHSHLQVLCFCSFLQTVGLGMKALCLGLGLHLLWLRVGLLASCLQMLCMSLQQALHQVKYCSRQVTGV